MRPVARPWWEDGEAMETGGHPFRKPEDRLAEDGVRGIVFGIYLLFHELCMDT